jgi:hypothetical protein
MKLQLHIELRVCTRAYPKFSGLSHNEVNNNNNNNNNNNKHSLRSNTKCYGGKTHTRLTYKIAVQLHVVAESGTICSSRSRRPVRKVLVTPSYLCSCHCLPWHRAAISLACNPHNTESSTWRRLDHRWGRTESYCTRSPHCRSSPGTNSNLCCMTLTFQARINSMEVSPSWEANSHSASQEIPRLMELEWSSLCFIRVRHWSLSWTRWTQSVSYHTIYLRTIIILFSHLRIDLP